MSLLDRHLFHRWLVEIETILMEKNSPNKQVLAKWVSQSDSEQNRKLGYSSSGLSFKPDKLILWEWVGRVCDQVSEIYFCGCKQHLRVATHLQ